MLEERMIDLALLKIHPELVLEVKYISPALPIKVEEINLFYNVCNITSSSSTLLDIFNYCRHIY